MTHGRRMLALRAGVTTAAASVAGSFARGLMPRSAADQAVATASAAAIRLGTATAAVAAAEVLAHSFVRRTSIGNAETALLVSSTALAAGCYGVVRAIPAKHDQPLPMATARSTAYLVGAGAASTAAVVGTDALVQRTLGERNPFEGMLVAAGLGALASGLAVWRRDRRASSLGVTGRMPEINKPKGAMGMARAVGMGVGGGAAILGLAGGEYLIAEGTSRTLGAVMGRDSVAAPLVGHAIALGALGVAGGYALNMVRRRIEHADDVVEPAYPQPPTSAHVTAGPNSVIGFDTIGKEGRRFVLMALTAAEIETVMGQPALQLPVRAVAGYEAADTIEERAALALEELERLGAYERSVIVVASPTGVGYVNYSFAEAVEYLTLGSSAIVVPQYALVPSALAMNQTHQGSQLQTLVLEGVRDRIAQMPEHNRPRLLQFGESLGAEVALDVARTTPDYDLLGIERGLYLGTPFRTKIWQTWFRDPHAADPIGSLGQVSQADEIGVLTSPEVRHVQIVHNDDPINKFSYDAVVRPPWWMGPASTRPPGVPPETRFRPVTTFIINLVDLKNGMNSKPGDFIRQGHDYRIELREAVQRAYGLPATAEQAEAIEQALRDREREWAARRMVARRFEKARATVTAQLKSWGLDPESLDDETVSELASGNLAALSKRLGSSGSA